MRLRDATVADMPKIQEFFIGLGLDFPAANRNHFVRPQEPSDDLRVVTRLMLGRRDEIVGLLGFLDRPLWVGGQRLRGRWPVNFFLAPQLRGRGLGKSLMRQVMDGTDLGLVLGGNPHSIPVLRRTGWRRLGDLTTFVWHRSTDPTPAAVSRVVRLGLPPSTPWAEARRGVVRDRAVLEHRFCGPLQAFHRIFHVVDSVDPERPLGYFVLSARRGTDDVERVKITDFDAVHGFENDIARCALGRALELGSGAEAHACERRFCAAFGALTPNETTVGLPLWILDPHYLLTGSTTVADAWHITHGDHDRYRQWSDSVTLCASHENPATETLLRPAQRRARSMARPEA